ncbi:MAG TPA: amidohydrolase family protein [Steroidobacteraceae bacterium]|nr:amidohydrolase family protein [Steroidobacteraceae bacterium]
MADQSKRPYLRIATEEAFCPPEMFDVYAEILAEGTLDDPGFMSQWKYFLKSQSERAVFVRGALASLGEDRIANMDAAGIDIAVLSLTSPGVQVMQKDQATKFAAFANDVLVDGIAKYPQRYYGLTAVAPQDPQAAAREIERGHKLGLKGVIIHSHTLNEYMDDQKFWPIFEAAEALDTPIYMHPNTPSRDLVRPLMERGLDGSIYGFSVETASHLLKIIISGALDRFPKLRFGVGHCGEAIPFWLYRLDHMHNAMVKAGRYPGVKPLQRKISEYVKQNFWITTSGMAWPPAIEFCQRVLGLDRVLYAMDYPYQYVPAEVGYTESVDISPEAMKMLFQTNAEQFFKLPPAGR